MKKTETIRNSMTIALFSSRFYRFCFLYFRNSVQLVACCWSQWFDFVFLAQIWAVLIRVRIPSKIVWNTHVICRCDYVPGISTESHRRMYTRFLNTVLQRYNQDPIKCCYYIIDVKVVRIFGTLHFLRNCDSSLGRHDSVYSPFFIP